MMSSRYLALVDDDEQFSAYLRTFLETRGYATRWYTRGDQLLAAIKSGDVPAVVLLDVAMPGTDGLATLRSLRQLQPDGQTIMLSGHGTAATIVEALRLGATDYLVKPSDPEGLGEIELEAAIKSALERRQQRRPAAAPEQSIEEIEETWWHSSEPMRDVARMIERVADSDVTVLVRGESGVGKELVTQAVHRRSPRAKGPLVKVNCAALPAELLESELFGHERGAFTGADTMRVGKFEHAQGGTILLDEIGEMSARLQAKLLHVLQDASFTRLGSNKPITVDARVIAATNRDIDGMITRGQFREDLYYRLKVIEICVPPLRERREELPGLISFFLRKYSARYQRPMPPLPDRLRDLLLNHSWPGNVRELENCLKRYVLLQNPELIEAELTVERRTSHGQAGLPHAEAAAPMGSDGQDDDAEDEAPPRPREQPSTGGGQALPLAGGGVPAMADGGTVTGSSAASEPAADEAQGGPGPLPIRTLPTAPPPVRTLPDIAREAAERAERTEIERALANVRWNRRRAAQQLGVSYKTLLNKIRELGIDAS